MNLKCLSSQVIHLCLCKLVIVKQVYSGVPQSQGWICTLLLEAVQKEKAWHVLTDSESGAATSAECSRQFHLHLWGCADLTAAFFRRLSCHLITMGYTGYSHRVTGSARDISGGTK